MEELDLTGLLEGYDVQANMDYGSRNIFKTRSNRNKMDELVIHSVALHPLF